MIQTIEEILREIVEDVREKDAKLADELEAAIEKES